MVPESGEGSDQEVKRCAGQVSRGSAACWDESLNVRVIYMQGALFTGVCV